MVSVFIIGRLFATFRHYAASAALSEDRCVVGTECNDADLQVAMLHSALVLLALAWYIQHRDYNISPQSIESAADTPPTETTLSATDQDQKLGGRPVEPFKEAEQSLESSCGDEKIHPALAIGPQAVETVNDLMIHPTRHTAVSIKAEESRIQPDGALVTPATEMITSYPIDSFRPVGVEHKVEKIIAQPVGTLPVTEVVEESLFNRPQKDLPELAHTSLPLDDVIVDGDRDMAREIIVKAPRGNPQMAPPASSDTDQEDPVRPVESSRTNLPQYADDSTMKHAEVAAFAAAEALKELSVGPALPPVLVKLPINRFQPFQPKRLEGAWSNKSIDNGKIHDQQTAVISATKTVGRLSHASSRPLGLSLKDPTSRRPLEDVNAGSTGTLASSRRAPALVPAPSPRTGRSGLSAWSVAPQPPA
jgi:hypothetical protein